MARFRSQRLSVPVPDKPLADHLYADCWICGRDFKTNISFYAHRDLNKSTPTTCVPTFKPRLDRKGS
jgi:hypothetical protein